MTDEGKDGNVWFREAEKGSQVHSATTARKAAKAEAAQIHANAKADHTPETSVTPLYDALVADIGYPVLVVTPAQPFRLYGYKKRKRLARDTSRVLSNEGFKS